MVTPIHRQQTQQALILNLPGTSVPAEITQTIGVMIVDDQPINRLGLKLLVAGCPGWQVVAEAADGQQAVDLVDSTRPDIILMDIDMPVMDGITAVKMIMKTHPTTKILILTSRNEQKEITEALKAGVRGYCLKDAPSERIVTALHVIQDGNLFLDSGTITSFASVITENSSVAVPPDVEPLELSHQELQFLSLKMNMASDQAISKIMSISIEHVQKAEANVKEKITKLKANALTGSPGNGPVVKICTICDERYLNNETHCLSDASPLFTESVVRRLGSVIGDKYELLEFIGRGGGAEVFKAQHKYLRQHVALKLINAEYATDFSMLQRFRYEAECASRMNHPNIVKVYDFGLTSNGTPYIAMEYLEGYSLAKHLTRTGPLPFSELVRTFGQLCSALEHAHQNDLVHRDVKPANIFISHSTTGESVAKLVDFGLAKSVGVALIPNFTLQGEVVGTPWYMSPEGCTGEVCTPASDIYSLGCTMYEAATGSVVFPGELMVPVMLMHLSEEAPKFERSDLTNEQESGLRKILEKCLQKKPAERYESVTKLAAELATLQYI